MANPEHVEILNQGVRTWNAWRKANIHNFLQPDLEGITIHHKLLNGINFDLTNLSNSTVSLSILDKAICHRANFQGVIFKDSMMRNADIVSTTFKNSILNGAVFSNSNIDGCDFAEIQSFISKQTRPSLVFDGAKLLNCNFRNATLTDASMQSTVLVGCSFTNTNFNDTILGLTTFADVNLTGANLESLRYRNRSFVDVKTLYHAKGRFPITFLRGIGLPDDFIDYVPSLFGLAIEFYSCFISYSTKDEDFVKRLYSDLQNNNVRCYYAPEDMKIGDRILPAIVDAIQVHDKLLLILSENSVESGWVEDEVNSAFERERMEKKTILFPIRIDNAVMDTDVAWAKKIKISRNIGDFTDWKNHDSYKKTFDKLLRDLKTDQSNTVASKNFI